MYVSTAGFAVGTGGTVAATTLVVSPAGLLVMTALAGVVAVLMALGLCRVHRRASPCRRTTADDVGFPEPRPEPPPPAPPCRPGSDGTEPSPDLRPPAEPS